MSIGSKWHHTKRGSDYVVVDVLPYYLHLATLPDGFVAGVVVIKDQIYYDVLLQRSEPADGSDWWLYENDEGMQFLRPSSEFTAPRFTRVHRGEFYRGLMITEILDSDRGVSPDGDHDPRYDLTLVQLSDGTTRWVFDHEITFGD